ncbi:replication factor C subunit 3-like [Andrographis paniculata]|uniref:replication factor C subunit 3-like n=1 Tax=Andrographis paniculata TaxID=175694 RepID=UPI0021E7BEE0|nr:replication factor C subunit 3-like [Andrographis paniculata]
MPPPSAFRQSASAPDISRAISSADVHSRDASTQTTESPVASRKLAGYIKKRTKKSNLTDENLREFDRKNDPVDKHYSPYYKGLTDFSLDIRREKQTESSPGRENHSTTFVGSAIKLSFLFRVHEWSSYCFASKPCDDEKLPENWGGKRSSNCESKNKFKSERKLITFSSSENMLPLSPPMAPPPESFPCRLPHLSLPVATLPEWLLPDAPARILQTKVLLHRALDGDEYESAEMCNDVEKERVYTWLEKYRPLWLKDFVCNRKTAQSLQNLAKKWRDENEEFGHFVFEGNPRVGKRTMIRAFLREAFGQDVVEARDESKEFFAKGQAGASVVVNLRKSRQHIEVNLSELKGYEKHVMEELVKDKNRMFNCDNFKAVILYDVDKLPDDSLASIERILETLDGYYKVFFCCNDAKKLDAVKKSCTFVKILDPSHEEILEVLETIAKEEKIELSRQLASKIAKSSKNNLRQAIRSFEATWHSKRCCSSLIGDCDIKTGWEDEIANIAEKMLKEQTLKQLYSIQEEIQRLLEHNIDPKFIFQTLKEALNRCLPEDLRMQFIELFEEHQKSDASTEKSFPSEDQEEFGRRKNDYTKNIHQFMEIEEFIAKVMSWYKSLNTENMED